MNPSQSSIKTEIEIRTGSGTLSVMLWGEEEEGKKAVEDGSSTDIGWPRLIFRKLPKNQKYIYHSTRERVSNTPQQFHLSYASTHSVPTSFMHIAPGKSKTCRLFVNANFLPFPLSLAPPKTKASQFGHC